MSFLDLAGVEAKKAFEPMRPGTYLVQVDEADLSNAKSGQGMVLKLTFKVVEGEFEKYKLKAFYNVINNNQQAQDIAKAELKALMVAAGRTNFTVDKPADLVGLKANARVTLRKSDNGEMYPQIAAFLPVEGAAPQAGINPSESFS